MSNFIKEFQLQDGYDKYVVVNVLKSNGNIYFGQNPYKIYSLHDAQVEAERRAKTCSKDYRYAVVRLSFICSAEAIEPQIKTTFFR